MSTYSADISVKVVGLSSLATLEKRVQTLQARFTDLNEAAAGVTAPFANHIRALERLNTLLVANGRLLNEQAAAVQRMDRVASRTGTSAQTDPRIEKERTGELMRQLGLLKERARSSDAYVQVMAKLLRAEVEISAAVGGNVALGKELMKNARALLVAEERVAAAKAKGAAQAIKDAETERNARLKAVADLERAEERRIRNQERAEDRLTRNRERARQQEERDQYNQERRNSRDSRTVANVAGRVGGAVDGAFGNVFSKTGKALEGATIRGGAVAGLLGTAGVVAAGEKLSILGQNLIPQMSGASGAVEGLLNALAQIPGGMGAAAVAAAAFAPWLPKIAEGAYAAGDAVGKLKPAQPLKRLLSQGGGSFMESPVNALSGNLDMKLDTSRYESAGAAAATAFASRFNLALMGKLGQGITDQLQKESDKYFKTLTRNQQINASWAAALEEGAAFQAQITRDAQAEARARADSTKKANISAAENRIGGLRYAIREATGDRFNSGTAQQNANSIADMRARGLVGVTQLNAIRRANPNQYDSRGAMPAGNDAYKQAGYLQAANTQAARAQLTVESKTAQVRYSWVKALRDGKQIQRDIVASVKAEELAAKQVTAEEIRKSRIRSSQATREARAQKLRDKKEAAENRPESLMLGVGFPLMFGAGAGSLAGSFAGSFVGSGFGGQIFGGAMGMFVDQFAAAAQTTAASLRYPIESFEDLKTAGMFANREQEQLIGRLIELGRVSEAAEKIQAQIIGKIGDTGARDMLALDESTVRLSKAMADLNLQMQALLAGPLGALLARMADAAGTVSTPMQATALSADLRKAGKGDEARKLDDAIQRIEQSPQALFGLDPGGVRKQMEAAIAESRKSLPPSTVKARLTPEDRIKEATAQLDTAERAEALRRQGVQLERSQQDARLQIEDQVYSFRQRAADLERAGVDLRRSVEAEIFRKRQEIARLESDNTREQARLAIERLDMQLGGMQVSGNVPGQDIANGLLSAVQQYVKTRGEAEADFQQKERNFNIEMVELKKASERFSFDVARKVADLQRQTVEYGRDVKRAILSAERTIYDLQLAAADYAVAKAKERIALEVQASQQIQQTQQLTQQIPNGTLTGRYSQGGYGPSGPNAYGAHFDIARTNGAYFGRNALDQYVEVNGRALSSGYTVPGQRGGKFGADRDRGAGAHRAWDYAFGGGASLGLKNGAKWMSSKPGSYGDNAVFMTPDGQMYRIIHGKFNGAITAGAAAAASPAAAAAAAVPSATPRPVDTAGAIAGLSGLRAPAVPGVGDLMATSAALDTNIAKVKQFGLELAKAYSAMTKEGAAQALTQQVTATIDQLNAPLDQLLKSQQDQLAYEREYAGLIAEGITPALAEQLAKIQQQTAEQLRQYEVTLAMADALKLKLEGEGKWTAELQRQYDLLKAQKGIIEGKGAQAAAVATQDDPGKKVRDHVTRLRGELADTDAMIVSMAGTIEGELSSAMSNAVMSVMQGTISIQEAFSQMFLNIGAAFIEMATQMIAKALIMKVLGILGGGMSGGIGASNNYSGAFGSGPSTSFGDAMKMPSFFADGGYVTGPTNAVIGENGENEFVIPESKMGAAMQRYSTGSRGSNVIPGSGDGGSGGDSQEGGGGGTFTLQTVVINQVEYATVDQVRQMGAQSARQGAAAGHQKVFGDLRNSRSRRSRIGMGG